jgi:hypothetical protein
MGYCSRIGISVFLAVSVATSAWASEIGEELVAQLREASYRHLLDTQLFTHLEDDRTCSTGPQSEPARDNIADIFGGYGLDVMLHTFEGGSGPGTNVVATQWGTVQPDSYYIVSAHRDSVGNGGADDDASGVAALLEMARVLSAYETEYTIKYIAFDHEECGLQGSVNYMLEHIDDDIRGVVNVDMIAWNSRNWRCQIFGGEASNPLKNAVAEAFAQYDVGVTANAAGNMPMGTSDHAPFEYAGFQSCVLMERGYRYNPYFHTFRDTVDLPNYIDYEYATEIACGVAGFLADHAVAQRPYDCNGDGIADVEQIDGDPGLDCNGNHILDECEFAGDQDANGNGVPDLCDIETGGSDDCNGNWIPDESEPGSRADCNGNGIPDLCDVATHASDDFNYNNIPDECEGIGTIHVDDDAPNDPGPGDPLVSDPAEDGTWEHPFDSIAEAVAISFSGDEVVLQPGQYSGPGNQAVWTMARKIVIRSAAGPQTCRIEPTEGSTAFIFNFHDRPQTVLQGLTIANGVRNSEGVVICTASSPTIVNCVFDNNTVNHGLGGALLIQEGSPQVINCLFSRNQALRNWMNDGEGGAVYVAGGAPRFWNCTFADNLAADRGGALLADASNVIVANSVLYGNAADEGPQIAIRSGGTTSVSFSDVAGGPDAVSIVAATLDWGPGNIDADPLFADPNEGDFHLRAGSLCIDAGGNALVPFDVVDLDQDGDTDELTPLDLDYEGRFFDDPNTPDTGCGSTPIVDMGAYEFGGTGPQPCVGDLDGDGDVDLADLAELLSGYGQDDGGDLDCDGDTDMADLTALLAAYGDVCP